MEYTFDVSRFSNKEQLVTFEAPCESKALKQAIWYHNPGLWENGRKRAALIMRRADLEAMAPLSARLARRDLNDAGLFRI